MGKIDERFRLSISQLGDWKAAVRSTERVYNERPYPTVYVKSKTGDQTLSTASVVILTIPFTTYYTNSPITVDIICDFDHTVAGAVVAIGEIYVDTVLDTNQAILSQGALRATTPQVYAFTIDEPGDHMVELAVRKTAAGGTCIARFPHTKMRIVTYW